MRTLTTLISLTLLAPAALADPTPGARVPTAPIPASAPTSAPASAPASAPSSAPASAAPPPVAQPPGPQLAPIDAAALPASCKSFARPAQLPSLATALSARISLASCLADQAIAPLALCDCGQSILDIDQAVAPAIALLDNAIAAGDPVIQAIAQHTKGELYVGFATRMVATLPRPSPNATQEELNLRDLREQTLAAQLAPWRDTAKAAFAEVVELAKAHPEIARNPAAATAIRDSQQRVAADVAAR
ncbi:MAG TPA: hypothetical protein VH165_01155 [Kofleriaceae bacterium]|jgi:hypothetical protein|nr:hypothetical protein [Kofleriaceae bacterium]